MLFPSFYSLDPLFVSFLPLPPLFASFTPTFLSLFTSSMGEQIAYPKR